MAYLKLMKPRLTGLDRAISFFALIPPSSKSTHKRPRTLLLSRPRINNPNSLIRTLHTKSTSITETMTTVPALPTAPSMSHTQSVSTASAAETVVAIPDASTVFPMSHTQSASSASATETIVVIPTISPTSKAPSTSLPKAIPDVRVIPKTHSNRTLVLCFDGTGKEFDKSNSNIVKLIYLLINDKSNQLVYYQAGIGTYTTHQFWSPMSSAMSMMADEAVAWNLDNHVMAGYTYLMQTYSKGDRICLFGFSRGAYTARALAGMVHKVGLLPPGNAEQVPFAYKTFKRDDHDGWEQSTLFKRTFCDDVDIEFVGVWDTVESVGVFPHRLPFTRSNTAVRTFRHAMSLDEHRVLFQPKPWDPPTEAQSHLGTDGIASAAAGKVMYPKIPPADPKKAKHSWSWDKADTRQETLREFENDFEKSYPKNRAKPTDILEVWFAGCHCDVGGGSVKNKTRNSLARIPLRWMIRECFKTNSGIMFDAERLREIGLDPDSLCPKVLPRLSLQPLPDDMIALERPPGWFMSLFTKAAAKPKEVEAGRMSEEQEELRDALSPIYDQLYIKRWWWLFELFVMRRRYQNHDTSWVTKIGWNFGAPRVVPRYSLSKDGGVRVHRSVRIRMGARPERGGEGYRPRAQLSVEPIWVD